jgi:hypothetical protein
MDPLDALYGLLNYVMHRQLQDQIENIALSNAIAAESEAVVMYVPPVAVFAAMIYGVWKSDQQVLELVQNENTKTGITQGTIMGMLGWKWSQVDELFVRHHVMQYYQRQDLNDARVLSYNVGLRGGYHYAAQLSPAARKGCLKACRKFSGATPGAWSQRDQINYVIDMAVAYHRIFMPFW